MVKVLDIFTDSLSLFVQHLHLFYRVTHQVESYICCNQFGEFPRLVGCYCS